MLHKLNNNIIDERLKNRSIKRLGDYINIGDKLLWKCEIRSCNFEWLASSNGVIGKNQSGCPKCMKHERFTNEVVDRKLKEQNKNIIRLEDVLYAGKPIKWRCEICEYIWKTTPSSIIGSTANHRKKNGGCPKCSGRANLSNEIIDQRLFDNNRSIKRIGQFKNVDVKIDWQCTICNYIWKTAPYHITNRLSGCPQCKLSKGIVKITSYLNNNSIKYQTEYRIDQCKHIRILPFDVAIIKNDRLLCLIEYDGRQHFDYKYYLNKGSDEITARKEFELTQLRDSIKTKYCIDKGIKLIRIPYTDFNNIESILENELK